LVEIKVLEHPESRLRNLDIVSDKPGRDFESVGTTRHGVGHCTTPKKHEFDVFAHEIAAYLREAKDKGEFDQLYISAAPHLLGLLRQAMDPVTLKSIHGETDKDMTQMKPHEILTHLPFWP
jgi:protein required for attachment to host cells